MKDGEHDGFDVQVRVHVDVPKALDADEEINITISGSWNDKSTVLTVHESGIYNATLFADAKDIELWWPNGLGDHPLYEVKATTSSGISTSRHVGFRHFAIVTGNETDPSYVSNSTNQSGTSDFGMHFRVNGASVFSRGANMIPMEELEGRSLAEAHRRLVYSASDAGFNTFRIWGGGIFLPNAFYDACDEKGIMLYHDMMFAQQGHSPQKTETQKREFKHQARRLSHHASIVIWDGCNECVVSNTGPTSLYVTSIFSLTHSLSHSLEKYESSKFEKTHDSNVRYANFVLTTIAEEDKSRSVWPACPAAGYAFFRFPFFTS
jgi:beta-galactosidase/beta-glucuronidase